MNKRTIGLFAKFWVFLKPTIVSLSTTNEPHTTLICLWVYITKEYTWYSFSCLNHVRMQQSQFHTATDLTPSFFKSGMACPSAQGSTKIYRSDVSKVVWWICNLFTFGVVWRKIVKNLRRFPKLHGGPYNIGSSSCAGLCFPDDPVLVLVDTLTQNKPMNNHQKFSRHLVKHSLSLSVCVCVCVCVYTQTHTCSIC
jgi:hypothetical protein